MTLYIIRLNTANRKQILKSTFHDGVEHYHLNFLAIILVVANMSSQVNLSISKPLHKSMQSFQSQ
jgi:hypothetical protein